VLISCIIPTRNRPEFVIEAAMSVLAQRHEGLELIIVNDGSTPVPKINDMRVRIIDSGQRGAVPARNLGLLAAKGDAIAWLDDDDVWTDAHFLSYCCDALQQKSDFVFGDGALVASPESLMHDNTILISSVCYRRSLHDGLGMFDEALPYYWDWDWYLRVARSDHLMTRIMTPVVDIRIHTQNMSGDTNSQARNTNLKALCDKHKLPEIPLKSHIDFV
jgi:glycosyltransferase involved in cell wall biosynthesis